MNNEQLQLLIETMDNLSQPHFFDWITIFISGISILISSLAIFFAVKIPKTIASKQNTISLFEKRYNTMIEIIDILNLKHTIKIVLSLHEKYELKGIRKSLAIYTFSFLKESNLKTNPDFNLTKTPDENVDIIRYHMFKLFAESNSLSNKIDLLFSSELSSAFSEILKLGGDVYCFPTDEKLLIKRMHDFMNACDTFEEKSIPLIKTYMKI